MLEHWCEVGRKLEDSKLPKLTITAMVTVHKLNGSCTVHDLNFFFAR